MWACVRTMPARLSHFERQCRPVLQAEFLQALKHAAIDQDLAIVGLQQILRSGDGFGSAVESELDHLRSTFMVD